MSPRSLSRRDLVRGTTAAAALALIPLRITRSTAFADEDATQLLQDAAQAMADLTSFSFLVENEGGTTKLLNIVELESVEGEVLRPESFHAKATAKVAVLKVNVDIIGVDGNLYVSDPTAPAGTYLQLSTADMAGADIASVINPDALILKSVTVVEDPKIDGTAKIDDVEMTKVSGVVVLQKVIDLAGIAIATPTSEQTPAPGETQLILDQPLDVTFWIDGDHRIRRIRIIGAILTSDDPGIARRIDFTNFNEPVTIEAPANATPMPSSPGGP
jgi:LppX_LprAFG lipoprotein